MNVWAGATQLSLIVFIGQYGGRTSLQDMAHNGQIHAVAKPQPAYSCSPRPDETGQDKDTLVSGVSSNGDEGGFRNNSPTTARMASLHLRHTG